MAAPDISAPNAIDIVASRILTSAQRDAPESNGSQCRAQLHRRGDSLEPL
jgi:hypothetical protein